MAFAQNLWLNYFSLLTYIFYYMTVLVNGFACQLVDANDFFFSGLHLAGNTSNTVGSIITPVTVSELPGLNTLGICLGRIDFAPKGIQPLHTHPRATEIVTVIEGTLDVGFVTTNPENRHISKVLQKGDVFVFPEGLVHYQRNVGYGSAAAIAALPIQNPGINFLPNTIFGPVPEISSDVLAKTFQLDKKVVMDLQKKF